MIGLLFVRTAGILPDAAAGLYRCHIRRKLEMSDLKLEAQPRELTGRKVSQLRRQGLVPVVVYGNVKQPVNLQVAERSLDRLMHAGGATQVVEVIRPHGGVNDLVSSMAMNEVCAFRKVSSDNRGNFIRQQYQFADEPHILSKTQQALHFMLKGLWDNGKMSYKADKGALKLRFPVRMDESSNEQ